LGLYHGIPHVYRGQGYSGVVPDKITIYARPIEQATRDPHQLPDMVRRVVWHEIGHHFGFDDQQLSAVERNWERRRTKKPARRPSRAE
jgi:predicted Zn-dependent protease with MMP-like domain